METGKVALALKTDRTWDSAERGWGVFDIYSLEIDQGEIRLKGTTMVKQGSECKFKEGQEAQFTKTEDSYAKDGSYKFKWASEKKEWSGGGGRAPENPKVRNISFAASYAKDILCAGRIEFNQLNITADMILAWMNLKVDELK